MQARRYAWVKELAITVAAFAIPYYLFLHRGHFTKDQAGLLAGMTAGLILVILSTRARETSASFAPYYIRIEPRWYAILHDQGLIDEERWKAVGEEISRTAGRYNVLRDGVMVTVLGRELYYSNNHKVFYSKLDVDEEAPELLAPEERGKHLSFAPRVYGDAVLEKRQDSYIECIQLGLVTAESSKKTIMVGDKMDRIPLASIPHKLFSHFYGEASEAGEREAEELLRELGWTRRTRDVEDDLMDWPYEIDHKYFRVSYHSI